MGNPKKEIANERIYGVRKFESIPVKTPLANQVPPREKVARAVSSPIRAAMYFNPVPSKPVRRINRKIIPDKTPMKSPIGIPISHICCSPLSNYNAPKFNTANFSVKLNIQNTILITNPII